MSTDHGIYCIDCQDVFYFQNPRDISKEMAEEVIRNISKIVEVLELKSYPGFKRITVEVFINDGADILYDDENWLIQHKDHNLRVTSEYEDVFLSHL